MQLSNILIGVASALLLLAAFKVPVRSVDLGWLGVAIWALSLLV